MCLCGPRNVSGRGKPSSWNEDIVYAADENGNGDAKTAQRRSVKRRQREPANAKLRNKRTKEPSRKRRGRECGRDEKSGQYRWADQRKMFVTTDECGKLKMLPLRTCAKQHDDEVDSVANANPQPSQAQLFLPQVDVPPPPRDSHRQSRWCLVGSFYTMIPVIRSLALPFNRLRNTFKTRRTPF